MLRFESRKPHWLTGAKRPKEPNCESPEKPAKVETTCPAGRATEKWFGHGARVILENSTVCQIVDELVCNALSATIVVDGFFDN